MLGAIWGFLKGLLSIALVVGLVIGVLLGGYLLWEWQADDWYRDAKELVTVKIDKQELLDTLKVRDATIEHRDKTITALQKTVTIWKDSAQRLEQLCISSEVRIRQLAKTNRQLAADTSSLFAELSTWKKRHAEQAALLAIVQDSLSEVQQMYQAARLAGGESHLDSLNASQERFCALLDTVTAGVAEAQQQLVQIRETVQQHQHREFCDQLRKSVQSYGVLPGATRQEVRPYSAQPGIRLVQHGRGSTLR